MNLATSSLLYLGSGVITRLGARPRLGICLLLSTLTTSSRHKKPLYGLASLWQHYKK